MYNKQYHVVITYGIHIQGFINALSLNRWIVIIIALQYPLFLVILIPITVYQTNPKQLELPQNNLPKRLRSTYKLQQQKDKRDLTLICWTTKTKKETGRREWKTPLFNIYIFVWCDIPSKFGWVFVQLNTSPMNLKISYYYWMLKLSGSFYNIHIFLYGCDISSNFNY